MFIRWKLLIGILVAASDCTAHPDAPTSRQSGAAPEAAEGVVRGVIAERLKIDAFQIPMDKPISDPPLKADDLDLVEIVMDLEERHGVEISDAAIERYLGGKFGVSPPQITPNQLAKIVLEAPKLPQTKRKK